MRCGQLGIRMDDFVLVHNIAPSSYTFLRNNLSLQIYDTFITSGQGYADILRQQSFQIYGYGYLHTSLNKFYWDPYMQSTNSTMNRKTLILC